MSFSRARVMRLMQTMSSFLSEYFERFSIFGYKYGSRLVTDRTGNIPPTQNISFYRSRPFIVLLFDSISTKSVVEKL